MGKRPRRKQLADPVGIYYDSDVDEMIHSPETIEITESDDADEFIGLYDQDGDPLYRVSERIPLGFHHREPVDEADEEE